MFEWKAEYAVEIASIDGQHRNLFRIGAELHAAMKAGHGQDALAKILDRLVQYTASHFAHEERLLQVNGYPSFAAHKSEHDRLTRQVIKFKDELAAGKVALTVDVLQFLRDWLDKHIMGSDRKYAPYLRSKAVA